MENYKIYCGGRFIHTKKELLVYNPYNQTPFAKTFLAGNTELDKAIAAAKSVQEEMKQFPAYKRSAVLNFIADNMEGEGALFSGILAAEAGKPMKYAKGEISRAVQTFRVAAEECKRLPREYLSLDWTPAGEKKEGLVKYFPVGLVAGISPFNFPMNLAVHKIAPAIASGCPIILKPATSTPLSTLALAEIIDETELPKGAVSVLPMDRTTGNLLVTDERFKLLTFTGSPEVGWKMKSDAGKKKVVLELGGNAGVIVTESGDLELALKKCLIGGFAYSGQVCIHAQRFFIHEKIFTEFSEAFSHAVTQLKQGDPLHDDTDISAMIDEKNAIRVEDWIKEAVEQGARILCGGKRKGTYVEPTVLTQVKSDMKVCKMEVFGPVVSLEKFSDFHQALKEVNNSRYGLQAGVFTNKISEMDQAFDQLEVGGVIINDVPTFRVDHMPYGGLKDSGLGREGVRYAMHDMLEPRLLVKGF